MIKAYASILYRYLILTDVIVVMGSFLTTYHFYLNITKLKSFDRNIIVFILFMQVIAWIGLLYYEGSYRPFRTKKFSDLFYIVFKSAFIGLFIMSALLFLFNMPRESRDLLAFSFLITTFLLCLYKALLLLIFHFLRKHNYNTKNLLILGVNKRSAQFIDLVKKNPEWGFKIVGVVDEHKEAVGKQINGQKIIGVFDDIPDIVHNKAVVDEVVFIVPRSWLGKIMDIVSFCETEGLTSSIAVDLFDLKIAKSRQINLQGFPMIVFETTPSMFLHNTVKRLFDVVVSFFALAVMGIPLLIIAILIKITSKGDLLFCQERKGLHGRIFTLYKFRTMVHNAEEKLSELRSLNQMQGPVFKLDNDPRITPLGKILRKFSIDEFPQFWNVLIGDMSIVGPRPPLANEVILYENWQRRRLSMRPGLTCIWQVEGRNKITDFKKWVELDLQYIDNWSLLLDMKIFFKTIPTVLFGIGAE